MTELTDNRRERTRALAAWLQAIPKPRWPRRSDVPAAAPGGVVLRFRTAALWAIAALITAASAASFSESYRGLLSWALRHGLAGFWAAAFPVQVDTFIAVGELVLFVAMVDQWDWPRKLGAWAVALLGLAISVAGNIGHLAAADLSSRATAGVPPLAAFAALWLGLTVLKSVISRRAERPAPDTVLPEVPTDNEVAALLALRATTYAGNPLSARALEAQFGLSRAQSTKVRQLVLAKVNGSAP